MKKWMYFLCNAVSFLLISASIFGLILYVPPVPGDSRYVPFVILSALFGMLIGGMIVYLFVKNDRG